MIILYYNIDLIKSVKYKYDDKYDHKNILFYSINLYILN